MLDFVRHTVPAIDLLTAAPVLTARAVAFAAGRRTRSAFKEDVLTRFFAGWTYRDFEHRACDYAEHRVPRLVRDLALDRLRWHAAHGHRVVVVTASLEAYVAPWARRNGVGDVLGTRVEVDGAGRLTGRLEGLNCYGAEKVARLRALVPYVEDAKVYVYGDSRGDRELLAMATHPAYRPFRRRQVVAGGTS